jgi:hypothetical protein
MPFTTVQYKKFFQAALATTLSTQYTVPAAAQDTIKGIDINNTTGAAISVTMYLVPSGGVAGQSNEFLPAVPIPANTIFHWTGTQVLNTGDFIQTSTSATGCTAMISGLEST